MSLKQLAIALSALLGVMGGGLVLPDVSSARARARPRPQASLGCVPRVTKAMRARQSRANAAATRALGRAMKRARLTPVRMVRRFRLPARRRGAPRYRVGQIIKRGRYRQLVVGTGWGNRGADGHLRLARDGRGDLWSVRRQVKRGKVTSYRICGCRSRTGARGIRLVPTYWAVMLPRKMTYKGMKVIRYKADRVFISYVGRCPNVP